MGIGEINRQFQFLSVPLEWSLKVVEIVILTYVSPYPAMKISLLTCVTLRTLDVRPTQPELKYSHLHRPCSVIQKIP